MGVTGLLPQLKEIQQNVSLGKFRGKTVAIDSYAWLHRAVFSCSWELAQDMNTDKYISYFQRRIKMLEHFGVTPYFVFDGDDFNSKQGTEVERAKSRQLNKDKGLEYLKNGDRKNANLFFTKCIDVTPQMAKSVIEYLKKVKIQYIVAPYEADPQLVYLEKLGIVDAIISEDSDLLVFGCKTLLTKLNEFGECIEISRDDFKKCKSFPFALLSQDQLRITACLSGCDYTNGIPNIGIVKALKLVKRLSSMKRCLSSLRLEGKNIIPKEFELEYEKANLSFQFQRVFNPIENLISTLNEPSDLDIKNPHFQECIGALLENETHKQIAYGDLDPITKLELKARDDFIERNVILSQFERKTTNPIQLSVKKVKTINSFFTKTEKLVAKPTPSKPFQDDTKIELSPTAKRRKLFNSESKVMTTSKFFRSNTEPTRSSKVEDSPLLSKVLPATQVNYPTNIDLNSSEFELTDIDDEEDEEDEKEKEDRQEGEQDDKQDKVNDRQKEQYESEKDEKAYMDKELTIRSNQIQKKDQIEQHTALDDTPNIEIEKIIDNKENDPIEDSLQLSTDASSESPINTNNILDELKEDTDTDTPKFSQSLFDKFALKTDKNKNIKTESTYKPQPLQQHNRTTLLMKKGRKVMKLSTLDKFVYRSG